MYHHHPYNPSTIHPYNPSTTHPYDPSSMYPGMNLPTGMSSMIPKLETKCERVWENLPRGKYPSFPLMIPWFDPYLETPMQLRV